MNIPGLCRPRVGVTPVSNLGVAICHYGAQQLLGQAVKPPYAREVEERHRIRINPSPEEEAVRSRRAAAGLPVVKDHIEVPFDLAFRDQSYAEIPKDRQLCWHALPYSRNILEAHAAGELPRIIILACNPDELKGYAKEIVGLWEKYVDEGILSARTSPEDIITGFPVFAPACNGIVMEIFMGSLDGGIRRSEKIMGVILSIGGKDGYAVQQALLRTVLRIGPYQAGKRYVNDEGELVYRPLQIDHLEVAGGTTRMRKTAAALINGNHRVYRRWAGLPAEAYVARSFNNPHLMDYLKAMLTVNINGYAIVLSFNGGRFSGITMGEMAESYADEMKSFSRAVYNIAERSGFMREDPVDFEEEFRGILATLRKNAPHKTSSVSAVEAALASGNLSPRLGPNETALFNPAIARARKLGMLQEAASLIDLRDRTIAVLDSLSRGEIEPAGHFLQ
jgi:hypothetical protein